LREAVDVLIIIYSVDFQFRRSARDLLPLSLSPEEGVREERVRPLALGTV
jgi:hypothetical protein